MRAKGELTLQSVADQGENSGIHAGLLPPALCSKLSIRLKTSLHCMYIGKELEMFEAAVTWSVCFVLSTEVDTKK